MRKNLWWWKSFAFPSDSVTGLLLLSHIAGKRLVHLPLRIWVICQMSPASLASCRWLCAHFFFTFMRAIWRALVASCLSIPSWALWARICAHVHSSDHYAAPLVLGAHFGLRVFLHASLTALLNSFTSLSRYSWAITPQQIADGSTGTML